MMLTLLNEDALMELADDLIACHSNEFKDCKNCSRDSVGKCERLELDAAEAIKALVAENEKLVAEMNGFRIDANGIRVFTGKSKELDSTCTFPESAIKKETADAVRHPSHYNSGNLEVWDAITGLGFGEGFLLGNVIKYVCRAGKKGSYAEDLRKAREYIDKAIAVHEEKYDA